MGGGSIPIHICYIFIIYHFSYIYNTSYIMYHIYIHITYHVSDIIYHVSDNILYIYCLSTKGELYATYHVPPACGLQEMEAKGGLHPIRLGTPECGGSINDKWIPRFKKGIYMLGSMYLYVYMLLMAKIRRSPVEVGCLSYYLQGFHGFYTSHVVQDFFHRMIHLKSLYHDKTGWISNPTSHFWEGYPGSILW